MPQQLSIRIEDRLALGALLPYLQTLIDVKVERVHIGELLIALVTPVSSLALGVYLLPLLVGLGDPARSHLQALQLLVGPQPSGGHLLRVQLGPEGVGLGHGRGVGPVVGGEVLGQDGAQRRAEEDGGEAEVADLLVKKEGFFFSFCLGIVN